MTDTTCPTCGRRDRDREYRSRPEVRAREAERKRSPESKAKQRIRDGSPTAKARYHRNYLANREKVIAAAQRWQAAHPEKRREYRQTMARTNPTIHLGGVRVRLNQLPEDLRPVALLIRETRLELRKGNQK